jgi:hypothetical protein
MIADNFVSIELNAHRSFAGGYPESHCRSSPHRSPLVNPPSRSTSPSSRSSSLSSGRSGSQLQQQQPLQQQRSQFDSFATHLATKHQGQYLGLATDKPQYLFLCSLNHKFSLQKCQVLSGDWCSNCRKLHSNLKSFATANSGQLLSASMQKFVTFRCPKNHTWTITYKKATQRWCKFCSRQAKRILKSMIQVENAKLEDVKRACQVV